MSQVAIVADSSSDLPPDVIKDLGITMVYLHVQFGKESYRDSIDLSSDEFYRKMLEGATDYPKTSAGTVGDFMAAYEGLAGTNKEILAITLGSKISATHNMAVAAVDEMGEGCRIEVIDTQTLMMAAGLMTIEAAKAAREGMGLTPLDEMVRVIIPRAHILMLSDNEKYFADGGHTSKTFREKFAATVGTVPLIEVKEEIKPFGKVNSRAEAIEALYKYASSFAPLHSLAVEYAMDRKEGESVLAHLKEMFPGVPAYLSQITAVVGAHFGPGGLAVSVLQA